MDPWPFGGGGLAIDMEPRGWSHPHQWVAETTRNGGLWMISATSLTPWGWPSHPLVSTFGGGFGHSLEDEPTPNGQGGGRSLPNFLRYAIFGS